VRRRAVLPLSRPGFHARGGRAGAIAAAFVAAGALLLTPGTALAATAPDQWTGSYADGGSSSTNAGETVITSANAAKVTTAWTSTLASAQPYAPMVLGGVAYRVIGMTPGRFVATSPRTGATLWSLDLPTGVQYGYGMAATTGKVLVAFRGTNGAGGVLAVDTAAHRILWRGYLPAATIAGDGNDYPGTPSTDGTRVYISGASNAVNAYRLSDGARLWSVPLAFNRNGTITQVDGTVVGGGLVYTSGQGGVIAYSATTGKRVWRSTLATTGRPVLAGGRVLVNTGNGSGVQAFTAAGCGAASCAPVWTANLGSPDYGTLTVGAADATNAFVTYRTTGSGENGACSSVFSGHIARLSASTGKVQWATTVGTNATGLIHGGSTIWLYDEYINGSCVGANRVLAYSATATGSTPLRSIPLSADTSGFPQSLALASGTLFRQTWGQAALIGYRVPNS
jgi:outer membrane protein assembly factor BamB